MGAWYDGLRPEVAACITAQLDSYRILSLEQWEDGREYKRLTAGFDKLEQFIFSVPTEQLGRAHSPRREHYRILGFSDEGRMEFTMLYGFMKTRGDLDYEEFGPIALARKRNILTNKRKHSQIAGWLFPYEE